MSIDKRIQALTRLAQSQLEFISGDPFEDEAVAKAAQRLSRSIDRQRLREAVKEFEAATPVFVELTAQLLEIVENSVAEGPAVLNPVLREAGIIFGEVAGDTEEISPRTWTIGAAEEAVIEDAVDAGGGAAAAAPAPGSATRSQRLSEIADEYRAMYEAAAFRDDRLIGIDRVADRMVAFRPRYERASDQLQMPWYFVGAVHALEASFNFGLHLHNGDPLGHRTKRVPAGRPEEGDPPFSWEKSARDALTFQNLHVRADWSLPALLFRLERYNGLGYRKMGLATPYLWSFSDRYLKGKYVADGKFDADHVSAQCGAAVVLKRLEQRGEIQIPR